MPIADITHRSERSLLFDHLVDAGEQKRRHIQADCLGGLKIDDQFVLGGLHDRQIARLRALEDTSGIDAELVFFRAL